MTLIVETPPTYLEERRYILGVMLDEFLGLDFQHQTSTEGDRRVRIRNADGPCGAALWLEDVLFQTNAELWLTAPALPPRPLAGWSPSLLGLPEESELPVLYGRPLADGSWCAISRDRVHLGIDLLGGAFFMLTRYEEAVRSDRDEHGRFPATASIAYQEGFLDRPIVNEYLDVLWRALLRLWPTLTRRNRRARILLSHDVDTPWTAFGTLGWRTLRSAGADVLLRGDPRTAIQRLRSAWAVRFGKPERDVLYTFDFLMESSEELGLDSAFYFLCGRTSEDFDGNYEITDPPIRTLLKSIHRRGHEIGLHPSYGSFRDGAQVRREFERLRKVCSEEALATARWGGRQHYLRWENPTTWQIWEDAGLDYDSTLSFADCPGFRCGVCYEYPVFNLRTRQRLALRERPLIVMEGTLLRYMKLSRRQATDVLVGLSDRCRQHAGDFTLLWHNSMLFTEGQKTWYRSILDRITAGPPGTGA